MDSVENVFRSPIKFKLSKENLKSKSLLEGINAVKDNVTDLTKNVIEVTKKTQ